MTLSTPPETATFGQDENLVGVFTPGKGDAKDLSVIMVTAGMLHSPGPFGLHTALADSLADAGVSSLRFDLSGIGESLASANALSSLERAASEISGSAEWITQHHGVKSFGLFGFCSGADDAIYTATKNKVINSVFAVDGCGYRTKQFYWHRVTNQYLPKVLNKRRWASFLAGRLPAKPTGERMPSSLELGDDIREFPSQLEAQSQLQLLGDRGVEVNMFYTGGVGEYYNYAAQFRDMFPQLDSPNVTSEYWPNSDHTAFLLEHRQQLVGRATEFFARVGE